MEKYEIRLRKKSDEMIDVRYSESRNGEMVVMDPYDKMVGIVRDFSELLRDSEGSELEVKVEMR